MKRVRLMTIGILLMFVGLQLVAIQNYWLTPRASLFLEQQVDESQNNMDNFNSQTPQYVNASYDGLGSYSNRQRMTQTTTITQKNFAPPPWLKWAALFAGAVLFLQGLATPR